MAFTWLVAVIGLSTVMVHGTVLPFSTRGGMSIFTLPAATFASPITLGTAAFYASGVACAETTVMEVATLLTASAPASVRTSRRVAFLSWSMSRDISPSLSCASCLLAQRRQERYHVLDLLGRQHR